MSRAASLCGSLAPVTFDVGKGGDEMKIENVIIQAEANSLDEVNAEAERLVPSG